MAISINTSPLRGPVCYHPFRLQPGILYLLGDDRRLLCATFATEREEREILLRYRERVSGGIAPALAFLESYFSKKSSKAPELDLSAYTEGEVRIYHELQKVPFGRTVTYGGLAERAGVKNGARFAGNTMAKNSFPIFIPCHRVIKSGGIIGNYTGGVHIKEFLLRHEGALK
ncbi:MAG: MGMT family protein [Spirochaetes bacterium]|nr:MAG: MGMT family protein [Spirochaetota bacterium]